MHARVAVLGVACLAVIGTAAADVFVGLESGSATAFRYQPSGDGYTLSRTYSPFGPNGSTGVRVATGDFNADGTWDLVAGAGPGAIVAILDGATGAEIQGFPPYTPFFGGGIFVAAADFDLDGYADLVTAPDLDRGPEINVYSGQTFQLLRSFYAGNPASTVGARVATGDVTGDGVPDIIATDGVGGSGEVRIYSGSTGLLAGSFQSGASIGGVALAAVDLNGDGLSEVITALGSEVTYWDGKTVLGANPTELRSFFGISPRTGIGVRLGAGDADGDGVPDVAVSFGPGASGVEIYSGVDATFKARINFPDDTGTPGAFVALSPLVVPEPSTAALLVLAGVGAGWLVRRRQAR